MSILIDLATALPPALRPFQAIKITTGLGKSRQALGRAEQLVRSGRQVVYLTKTVALADELAVRVSRDISVRVWRGRERENPERPSETMCVEFDLVQEAVNVLADPNEVVCPICPHRIGCAYLAQREMAPDIWFGASALLWHEMPAAMTAASFLVIDEAFALDGLRGLEGPPILVGIDALLKPPARRSMGAEADLVVDLMPIRKKLVAALDGQPLGWLRREPLVAAGLTPLDCTNAHKFEWRAKLEIKPTPGMTTLELRNKFAAAKGNGAVARRGMLWRAVERILADETASASGRVEIVEQTDKVTGVVYRALRLYGVRPIAKGWAKLPTLHLDATANIEVINARVPQARLVADIVADEPYVRVIQYPSHTFAKGTLKASPNLLLKTWYSAVSLAQQSGGNWLIVIQMDAEQSIRGWLAKTGGSIPPFIELGHHNALAGIDRYREVRGVIVIGRALPAPAEVERLAGVLTGKAVASCGAWYPVEMVTLTAGDGSMATVERDIHPDPLAEAIRHQICEDELMQIMGRGRGPNRTAANPLDVVIFGNVVLPLPLDELRVWSPASIDDELLARAGLTLSNGADLAVAFEGNDEQIKKRRQREKRQRGTFPYKEFLYGNVPLCDFSTGPLKAVTYRRAGPRHEEARAVYDPRMVPDLKPWLIEHLGPLAEFSLAPVDAIAGAAATIDASTTTPSDQDQDHASSAPVPEAPVDPVFREEHLPPASAAVATEPTAETVAAAVFNPPIQLDLFFDARSQVELDPLPEWTGGIAPPPIRQAILRELRRRGGLHRDLAGAVGLSRPQMTNLLRGRFGTTSANADALKLLLVGWRAA
jgi:putative DNA primase/helicase